MTFLELVNEARSQCGVAGNDLATLASPSSREISRLIGWVKQSWLEIQKKRRDWDWMRRSAAWDTVAGKQAYTTSDCGITRFGQWKSDSFSCYLKADGPANELELEHTPYDYFKGHYQFGVNRTQQGRPTSVAIAPDRSVLLGFIPNAVYTVEGDYYLSAQVLAADTDTPEMPEDFHMLIVYLTMQKYGLYEAAQEQITAGEKAFAPLYNELLQDQTPSLTLGDSLI